MSEVPIADLKAALSDAGWTVEPSVFFDMSHVYCHGDRRIALFPTSIAITTQRLIDPYGPVNVLDPVWQQALALIAEHMQGVVLA